MHDPPHTHHFIPRQAHPGAGSDVTSHSPNRLPVSDHRICAADALSSSYCSSVSLSGLSGHSGSGHEHGAMRSLIVRATWAR